MPELKSIGNGTFHKLAALRHFNCRNNVHLSEIHAHAFASPGREDVTREEWPPIQSVSFFLRFFLQSFENSFLFS